MDWKPALIAALSLALILIYKKLNPFWLISGSAGLGYLLNL
jgi:membrane protein required for beta-lactamase induction